MFAIILTIYSLILIFALLFLVFFFLTVNNYKPKKFLPVVYIYAMIFCNSLEIFMEFFQDIFPVFLIKGQYIKFRGTFGKYITFTDNFAYGFPIFLTSLMVTERFYVIFFPFGQAFKNRNLICYCTLLSLASMIFWAVPQFSDCPVVYDYYTRSFFSESECQHILMYLFDMYNWTIPVTCMLLNIILIVHISMKRRKSKGVTDRSSNVRKSHEKTMLIQAVSSTMFLLIFDITYYILLNLTHFDQLPELTRQAIIYSQKSAISLICFLIYFVGTPVTRKIIQQKFKETVMRKKKQSVANGNVSSKASMF